MKRIAFALIAAVFLAANRATVPFSRQPVDLPDAAYVDVLNLKDREATIGIRGVKVLRAEVYVRKSIICPELTEEGEWTSFKVNKGECFNFVFFDPADEKNHFAFVVKRDTRYPPKWLSPRIAVTEDSNYGACMAVK